MKAPSQEFVFIIEQVSQKQIIITQTKASKQEGNA